MTTIEGGIQQLRAEDIHDAWLVESKGFPSDEACSEEMFRYRHRVAPELMWGCFKDSGLVGILVATRTAQDNLTHEAMTIHDADGTLICIHSLCTLLDYRKKGIASRLMAHFLQFVRENLRDVTKVCLICHDVLIPFYEKLHFHCAGPSEVVHGSLPWFEMEHNFDGVISIKD